MGYFDVAGSPDTADKFDLKNFMVCFPDFEDILPDIKQVIDYGLEHLEETVRLNEAHDIFYYRGNNLFRNGVIRPIDDQSIVIRVVTFENNVYKSNTLFRHGGIENITNIESADKSVLDYDFEIKVSEYWLIYLDERVFRIFKLIGGKYELQAQSHFVLCDEQDKVDIFPYAFSFNNVEEDISDILTNNEIDSLLIEVFGYRDCPYSELIDGKAHIIQADMDYGLVSGNILLLFRDYLHEKKETQKRFNMQSGVYFSDNDIAIPSYIFVDRSKINEYYVNGIPEFVIEITMEDTKDIAQGYKKNLYEKYGVKEYWVADPQEKALYVYLLKDAKYEMSRYSKEDCVQVQTIPGLEINLSEIFEERW